MKLVTKKEARSRGLKWFFTGKPCKHGHIAQQQVANGSCRACARPRNQKRMKEWYRNNLQKARDEQTQRRRNDPRSRMVASAKARAKQKGLPFAITKEDIVIPSHCPALGLPLVIGNGSKNQLPNAPSLDRLIPELGYIPGNIAVISKLANQIKNSATPGQIEAVAIWLRTVYPNEYRFLI